MIGMQTRLIAGVVLLVVLIAAGFFVTRAIYDAGLDTGRAEKQVELDKFRKDVSDAATAQAFQNAKYAANAAQLDRETHDAYEAKIAAARADADQFAQRLYNAIARLAASGGSAAAVPGGQGPAQTVGSPSDDSVRQLSQLAAAVRTECLENDERLDALVAEVAPQVGP